VVDALGCYGISISRDRLARLKNGVLTKFNAPNPLAQRTWSKPDFTCTILLEDFAASLFDQRSTGEYAGKLVSMLLVTGFYQFPTLRTGEV
jgi:hypothetical protein